LLAIILVGMPQLTFTAYCGKHDVTIQQSFSSQVHKTHSDTSQ